MKQVPPPGWDAADKAGSLIKYADWLHAEARRVFDQDGTHVAVFFLFRDNGLCSINAIPPKATHEQATAGIRDAVKRYGLYAVMQVAESWAYVPKGPLDHTVVQLKYGEMAVADLKPEDRTEALVIRVESGEAVHFMWVAGILRDGEKPRLGESTRHDIPQRSRFFEAGSEDRG